MSLNGRHYENDSVSPLSNTEYFNYLYVFVVSSLRLFLILGWKQHQKKKKKLNFWNVLFWLFKSQSLLMLLGVSFDPCDLWIRL